MKKQSSNPWKWIVKYLLIVVFAVLIGVNLHLSINQNIGHDSMPMPFGYGVGVVLSGSMEPSLQVGDLILVKKEASYAENDIVVFQDGNDIVVHRIVKVNEDSVVTQGDSNDTDDGEQLLENIKGKVIGRIPFAGYLFNIMKNPFMVLALLLIGFWVIHKLTAGEDDDQRIATLEKEIEKIRNDKTE